MTQPVFVIGRRRSGTKWLSNILAGHPEVACVQGRRSGILETCMFDRFPEMFGDLDIDSNYYAFLACYSKTDFFRLTGMSERELFELRLRDYFGIFRAVMDRYAERQGRSTWVQKSKSYLLPVLSERFPDAKFVIIRRDLEDNLRSNIGLHMDRDRARPNVASVVANTLSYYYHRRSEDRFLGRTDVLLVRFEELKARTEETARRVCDFLGLEFVPEMLDTGYEPNTSFAGKVRKEHTLRPLDRAVLRASRPLIGALPLRVLDFLFHFRSRMRTPPYRAPRLLPSYFNLLKKEYEESAVSAPGPSEGEPFASGRPTGATRPGT